MGEYVIPGLVRDFWLAAFAGPEFLGEQVVLGFGRDFSGGII